MPDLDLTFVDETVQRLGRGPDAVIPILQALQDHYRYLPPPALERICQLTQITPASVAGVSTFYGQFRHRPVGQHIVRVCHGTACHVKGADLVDDALRQHLHIAPGKDTDDQGRFTIESVACLGCCTLAPVIQIDDATYGQLTAQSAPASVRDFEHHQLHPNGHARHACRHRHDHEHDHAPAPRGEIRIGLGSCCAAKGSDRLYDALQLAVRQSGAPAAVKRVGCVGMCHRTPLIEVALADGPSVFYESLAPADAPGLVQRHFAPRHPLRRLGHWLARGLDRLLDESDPVAQVQRRTMDVRDPHVTAFLDRQRHIATEHFGRLDPIDFDEYLRHEGFAALRRSIDALTPERVIAQVAASGLRGRGGAGFPTARKWDVVRAQTEPVKYVVCNGDEGDPGAFMDRMILESFPYRVIEGLALAAWAVGAHEGFFYIRAEYPLAVKRIREAIAVCERRGILGDRLMGTDFALRLSVKEGAGAFVCGEETALIASIEGQRGMPRLRPPFPAESGLWNKPTLVNNVETLAMLPWILRHGPDAFAALGTATSKGTKVFALAGKVRRGGLIEVPMGTTIRQVVEEIGGGVPEGRRFKAVQIGGPSGGCIPASLADTPIDYEALGQLGAIMGSGGLVVMDDTDCMVDIARYFLQFTQDQSCGKCTFCRVGTRRMLDILERICAGKGRAGDLERLDELARWVGQGSLCGLGKTAPNPVLTTLRYFRHEYEAHLQGRCPAGRCKALVRYEVTSRCTGCTICAQKCPVNAIASTPYRRHVVDMSLCTRCDTCRQVCPEHAMEVL